MKKRTLQFQCLFDLAMFSKIIFSGYVLDTMDLTITGQFNKVEIYIAFRQYHAVLTETTSLAYAC